MLRNAKKPKEKLAAINQHFQKCKIKMPVKIIATAKNILGLKTYSNFKLKVFAFGWRIICAAFFVGFLVSGISPLDIINASIKTFADETQVVNLYSSACSRLEEPLNFDEGWWNIDRAAGEAEVQTNGDLMAFSDGNSAFYAGGKYNLICRNFESSKTKTDILPDADEVENNLPEETVSEPVLEPENNSEIPENEVENETAAPTTTEPLVEVTDGGETNKDVEIDNAATSEPVETPEVNNPVITEESENNPIIEIFEEYILTSPISIFKKNLNRGLAWLEKRTPASLADDQPQVVSSGEDASNLGEFRSAKIKLSFAMGSIGQDEPANEINDDEIKQEDNSPIKVGEPANDASTSDEAINEIQPENFIPETGTKYLDNEGLLSNELNVDIINEPANSEDVNVIDSQADDNSDNIESMPEPAPAAETEITPEANNENTQNSPDPLSFLKAGQAKADDTGSSTDDRQIIIWYTLDDTGDDLAASQTPATSTDAEEIDEEFLENINTEEDIAVPEELSDSAEEIAPTVLWQKLGTIYSGQIDNVLNNGYLTYDAPFLKNWDDTKELKIKFEGVAQGETKFVSYLDSAWIEAEFKPFESDSEKMKRWKKMFSLLSNKISFKFNESLSLKFFYNKNYRDVLDYLGESLNLTDFWQDVDVSVKLFDKDRNEVSMPLSVIFENDGSFTVNSTNLPRGFKPGRYTLLFTINDGSGGEVETMQFEQMITWGVMAFNTNKSIFQPEETAYLQMAVLDNNGDTICDADLHIELEAPDGQTTALDTSDGSVFRNPECGPNNVVYTPDYYAFYYLKNTGIYKVKITAVTKDGEREIEDQFEVREDVPFDIERNGPTRIYPKADYQMMINVKAREDYQGDFKEILPKNFKVTKQEAKIKKAGGEEFKVGWQYSQEPSEENEEAVILKWTDINLEAGDELKITYFFDAPDTAPEFYVLGPARFDNFSEVRNWQIASDAVSKRSRTVRFYGGRYMGTGAGGQTSNTNYTYTAFNFRLAETNVVIKNAFLIFEGQYESFADTAGSSTGYTLAFDTCAGATCAPIAFTGTSTVVRTDSTNLSGPETESNQIRLLLDVTNEAQLAAYTGGNQIMRGQIGYSINRAAALANFISYTQAVLVLTYTYEPENSLSYTNTVIYPLESTATGDRGTRASSVIDDCVLNTSCPLFNYNMEAPDFSTTTGSSLQLSSWFQMTENAYANGIRDVTAIVNILGTTTNSASFINESANSDQGIQPLMFFTSVPGYFENATRTLQYQATTPVTAPPHYLIGGEVVDTYTASTSASVKTRTVSFPIGVINSGNTTATSTGNVNVYFPENGTASGTVSVRKVWLRILSNGYSAATATTSITTKIENSATTTVKGYNYFPPATMVKTAFNIYHVLPSVDYAELSTANAVSPKRVTVATKNTSANQGGLSAELMITYNYTDDTKGYLTSHELFAGQQYVTSRTQSTTTATANFVAPEARGKSIRGGALKPFYLISDSDGAMPGVNATLDANLSIGNPVCANSYISRPNGINGSTEFYKNIAASLLTTDNQAYNACYSNNGSGAATAGAKMNGTLIYTYQWDDTAPTSTFITARERNDGSGQADISILTNDLDGQNLKLKIEYATGTACSFISPADPILDSNPANITADFGTPRIDNGSAYQIGTTTGWVITSSGENRVNFIWPTENNLDEVEGVYCLRLTANDFGYDQASPATTTLAIDNKAPTVPGPISLNSRTNNSITLNFNATSTESNFKEYKIFYKQTDGTPVTESNSVLASSSDANLGNILFNNKSTTTVGSLLIATYYSFNIYAYDLYGHKASSTQVDITTAGPLNSFFNSASQKIDGSGTADLSIRVTDPNGSNQIRVKLEYVAGSGCNFASPNQAQLDDDPAAITATQGEPAVDNNYSYQLGTTTDWIETSLGPNDIDFDWLALDNLGSGIDGVYCLRITANDQLIDQPIPATSTINIDTLAPTRPGNLLKNFSGNDFIVLNLGATTTENHFKEYKIFYEEGLAGADENDTPFTSSTDPNLGHKLFNSQATTTISGLLLDTDYVFNIWAYDLYGNKNSALTEVSIKTNARPTGGLNSAVQKRDGTGAVAISIDVDDIDFDQSRAKIEYVAGAGCNFASPLDPLLNPASIDATIGTPVIDNNYAYQIGTTSDWIETIFPNTVSFDWLSQANIPAADGIYCLRLTVNDQQIDQSPLSTTTLTVDNTLPTKPGNLRIASTSDNSIALYFGASSTDTNFYEYKIFYREGASGATEADTLFGSSTDPNLGHQNYHSSSTATITGLKYNTQYVFNIWAYDKYGNKASATNEVTAVTSYIVKTGNWRWYFDYYNETPSLPVAGENSFTATATTSPLKLRLTAEETGGAAGNNVKLRLQYSTTADFSGDVNFVEDVGGSSLWLYAFSEGDDNSPVSSRVLSDSGIMGAHNETASTTSNFYQASSTAAEFEFSILNNGAADGATYYFRAYDNKNNQPLSPKDINSYPSIVASDSISPAERSRTVRFFSGLYSGNGLVGQISNTNYTLPAFNFRLGETGATVKNAFIIFEAQFESYANLVGSSTGYSLAFDSCLGAACTPSAFSGTGAVTVNDNTNLASPETESNQVRLLFDVTREAQLASYSGESAMLRGQVGYRINQYGGPVANFISYAQAVLVVTYTYKTAISDDLTNTVIYPLASVESNQGGSKATSTPNNCALNTNCPRFDYNMDIPEYNSGGSTNRLAQWFSAYEINNGNGANDVGVTINIQGTDIESPRFVHESANSDQAVIPAMFFSGVSGFSENTAQRLEYRASTTAGAPTHWQIGGEVFETYLASSSAPVKTRTVSFPIGVLGNGAVVSTTTSQVVGVYFPENGTATGTVRIKKAWLRIIGSNYNNALATTSVFTRTGSRASTTPRHYLNQPSTTTIKPSYNIFHILTDPGDIAALENANAVSSTTFSVSVKSSVVAQGGYSAELMITYAYSNEKAGYLVNNVLFAGQSATTSIVKSTTTATTLFVAPENLGKTIVGGLLQASYLISSANSAMGSANVTLDANLSTGNPSCVNSHIIRAIGVNTTGEFYKNVKSALGTTNGQAYNACYSNNGAGVALAGGKMNGMLVYSYRWDNSAPSSTFVSVINRQDTSGIIDVSIKAFDQDKEDLRVKLVYEAGTSCAFSLIGDATIDDNPANISALFGSPLVDNSYPYQIGTSTGWISTAMGENTVNFDWLSSNDLADMEGIYCLRLTANDEGKDQFFPATTTLVIDNKAPTVPGDLSFNRRTGSSITLNFGATSTENYFKEYKIFYKIFDGSPVTELDSVVSSSSDANLGNKYYNTKATTTISGLIASTTYSFSIWAYDWYGHKSSSSKIEAATNGAPYGLFKNAELRTDGSGVADITIEAHDPNGDDNSRAKIEYASNAICDFSSPFLAGLDDNPANISSNIIAPVIDNNFPYQVGTTSGWIITSSGANTIGFDWLAGNLGTNVEETYCLRLTVNDQLIDQAAPSTFTLMVDTKNPSAPGNLASSSVSENSADVLLGIPTTELNFKEYKIFYKKGLSGVTEINTIFSSSTDINLGEKDFNEAGMTTINGLDADTYYTFNIWAYDLYGHKASASEEMTLKTKGPPESSFESAEQRIDGSGRIDISFSAFDDDGDDARAQIEYDGGDDCDFAASGDPTIDPDDANTTATFGDPEVDNNFTYQIGTTTGWIVTSGGENTVSFDWLSKSDIPLANGFYCLRLTLDDQYLTQATSATTTIMIDNLEPVAPGGLTLSEVRNNAVILYFNDLSSDDNFKEYKIFYKEGDGPVTESDNVLSSSTDINLGADDFNDAATTTIIGLKYNTKYTFNIWAYDLFGNRSSSTAEIATTTAFIVKSQNWRWYYDYYNATPTIPAALENFAPSTISADSKLKLHLTLKEKAGASGQGVKFRLQYSTQSDFSSDVYFVGETGSTTAGWTYFDGGGNDDTVFDVLKLTDSTGYGTHNETGSSTSSFYHASNTPVEYEFTIKNNGVAPGQVYYFRVYDHTNNAAVDHDNGEIYPSLITSDSQMSFNISGLNSGSSTEGVILDVTSTADRINFGLLNINQDKTGAHRFLIDTNAGNGYELFTFARQDPVSNSGATILPVSGTNGLPDIWPANPVPSAYGYHTSDETLFGPSPSRFLADNSYARFESTMREVGYSPIPAENENIDIIYRMEASDMQTAGDYQTEIVYIIVPNF